MLDTEFATTATDQLDGLTIPITTTELNHRMQSTETTLRTAMIEYLKYWSTPQLMLMVANVLEQTGGDLKSYVNLHTITYISI
jgi:hypothetical protein